MSQPVGMPMISRRDCANAIRALAMDAVQKANSGHPGMPMGMADIAEVLWRDFLKFNPANLNWVDRDRFVLSNGHGAMLQYALLHLTGAGLTIEDIKQFRQWYSRTPGHPEFGDTPGVETTTGPLGQGLATGVGMAMAEQMLAATFNRENFPIVDHYTYVFAGDGDLMEGISHEACSLAGTWGLGKLIVFYDDNGVSIDGEVSGWFTDDTPKRFEAYHWHVVPNIDGHDPDAILKAIEAAQNITDKPSLICCKTIIGYGAPILAGKAVTHGAPLGEEEVARVRKILNWPHPPFEIPEEIYAAWDCKEKGEKNEIQWNRLFTEYEKQHPDLAKEFRRRQQKELPKQWEQTGKELLAMMQESKENNATRKFSLKCLNTFALLLPELIGGSADLSESNCTKWTGATIQGQDNRSGNYIKYGVREFAMTTIMNGMALHGGFIPFAGTFLTFSDYARNALRLAAMMKIHAIFIYSHDSIGLGEDGPTHQPIEQLPSLRMIPGLRVWRPCDGVETAVAWNNMIKEPGPNCLLLTRQTVAHQDRDEKQITQIVKGGYILWEFFGNREVILIASGSEVAVTIEAAKALAKENISVRVVSMPCCEIFKKQDTDYRNSVLPPNVKKRVAIEAAHPDYWYQFVGYEGRVIGIDRFGASAPWQVVYREYGFTVENILNVVNQLYK
ncbi:transketolase [Coxiella endosymbiont of Ornithodoros amblus]|uniref:transketolase n=1 Tax=Coxiella endosymbiont of Ornithodoros amblus TaxID=1656166 RepID=UPI00244E41D3|nr:transketolase [Coxiella endosymbiont of Ornithodoros amblus]MBW5802587.1 transketolase [Coxiella endosymbiont of Ornithodoros amblus]